MASPHSRRKTTGAFGNRKPREIVRDWSKPEFDDPHASTVVITSYLPAQEEDSIDSFHVIWHGELSGPDPSERDPYLALPLGRDFPTLAAAQKAVEREFKRRFR
jgi:hypothetical protein